MQIPEYLWSKPYPPHCKFLVIECNTVQDISSSRFFGTVFLTLYFPHALLKILFTIFFKKYFRCTMKFLTSFITLGEQENIFPPPKCQHSNDIFGNLICGVPSSSACFRLLLENILGPM